MAGRFCALTWCKIRAKPYHPKRDRILAAAKRKNPETASPRGAEDFELFPGAMSCLPDLRKLLISLSINEKYEDS